MLCGQNAQGPKNEHDFFWTSTPKGPGHPGKLPGLPPSKPKQNKLSREGTNFSTPTPSCGRPPSHPAVSRPKKLIFVLFFLSQSKRVRKIRPLTSFEGPNFVRLHPPPENSLPPERKHTNMNNFAGLSRDWKGGKILFCVFFGSFLMGGEQIHKQNPPKNPGTIARQVGVSISRFPLGKMPLMAVLTSSSSAAPGWCLLPDL